MEARSLLGDRRIALVTLSNEKLARHFVEVIEAGDSSPGRYETRLILIAGALKKTSKLRKTAESAKLSAALQLFPDSEKDIETHIRAALIEHGVEIEDEDG